MLSFPYISIFPPKCCEIDKKWLFQSSYCCLQGFCFLPFFASYAFFFMTQCESTSNWVLSVYTVNNVHSWTLVPFEDCNFAYFVLKTIKMVLLVLWCPVPLSNKLSVCIGNLPLSLVSFYTLGMRTNANFPIYATIQQEYMGTLNFPCV